MATTSQTPAPPATNQVLTLVSAEGYETFTATALTGTSATSVYTAAASALRRVTKVKKLVVANPTGGAVNITVTYRRASDAVTFTYYPGTSLAAAGTLVFDEVEITLEPLDELRVTGAAGIHCFVSAREYQGNVKG
jgi:hypothetical protein